MSVLALLRERQTSVDCIDTKKLERLLKASLTARLVFLGNIIDKKHQLLHGHIILGYSANGLYLISYQLKVDGDEVGETSFNYSIHWWQLELGHPLILVHSLRLFEGYSINDNLEIKLYQQESEETNAVVVIGQENKTKQDNDGTVTSYVSVVFPPGSEHTFSIHLSYELIPPLPELNPSLLLQLPNAVLLNTGYNIIILQYNITTIWTTPSTSHFCSTSQQLFLPPDKADTIHDTSLSPGQILSVEVYKDRQPLVECLTSNDTNNVIRICQYSIDIEQWLVTVLEGILNKYELVLCSLTDYDVKIRAVSQNEWLIAFVVKVKVETMCTDYTYKGHYLEILGSWLPLVGEVQHITHTKPIVIPLNELHTKSWSDNDPEILNEYKFTSLYSSVQVLSNKTVLLSGKSLSVLNHPTLPISLILTRPSNDYIIN